MCVTLSDVMAKSTHPMIQLFGFISPLKTRLWASIAAAICNKIADLMPPVMVGWIIDTVSNQSPDWIVSVTGTAEPWPLAITLSIIAVIVFGVESGFQWAYQYGFMTLAQQAQHRLRVTTYDHLQHKHYDFFENHRLGNTLSILNDDINHLERFLYTGLVEILHLGVVIMFSTTVMMLTSWPLACIGLFPIPFVILGSLKYQSWVAPWYDKVRAAVGALSNRLENNLSGILVIKSFTAEDYEKKRVIDSSDAYLTSNLGVIRHVALYVPIIRMVVAIGFAGVLLVGSYWVLNDAPFISVGELVLFAMLTQRVLWPLTRFGVILDDYQRACACATRVFTLLNSKSNITSPKVPVPIDPRYCDIEVSNVRFHYTPEIPILNNLSFKINHGETIGIAGTTGSGKSTLIKLLLRLYDPNSGSILINNTPINHLDITDLRRHIALVSQDTYLFHGSIYDNIAYGRPTASPDDVYHAASMAALHEFVVSLPNGYNTIVGERGIKLSGGQRQRLSIARAILKNAPFMIFDEATSSVDTQTEAAIQTSLFKVTQGKTAIIIAHRLSTIRNANRILVIQDGQVVEDGNHDTLIQNQGDYARLWRIQIGQASQG
jgi:ATP-binding cassette subfamily B protein